MSKQRLITRRKYALFLYELLVSLTKNNLIRITMLILTISGILTALTVHLCPSCTMIYLFLIIHLAIAFPVAFTLHELIHYVVLDTDVMVNFYPNFIKIEPLESSGSVRMVCSALAGPLIPFLIGLVIYCVGFIMHLNLFGIYFPFLIHILILPFDILGVFGVEFE